VADFKPKVWMHCPLCNKPSPMPDPDKREWVGLTDEQRRVCVQSPFTEENYRAIEVKLKENNCG